MKRIIVVSALLVALCSQAWAAFSITETIPGFRVRYFLGGGHSHELRIPGAASTAYTLGQPMGISATLNTAAALANGGSNALGVTLEAITTPAAATSSDAKRLRLETNLEQAVFEANFDAASWLDDAAAVTVSSDGIDIAFDVGLTYGNAAVDNSIRGHALVCYSGPGKGEWRYITAYDAAGGGTGSQQVSVDRPFGQTITTSSHFIILGTGSDGGGVVPGHATDLGSTSASKVKGSDGAGPLLVWSLERAYLGVIEVRFTDNVWHAP